MSKWICVSENRDTICMHFPAHLCWSSAQQGSPLLGEGWVPRPRDSTAQQGSLSLGKLLC